MKNKSATRHSPSLHRAHSEPSASAWTKLSKAALALIFLAAFCFGSSAQAQTTLLATNQNVYVGANFSGIYTNSQLRAVLSGTSGASVTLSVSGAPAGATILFSTNTYATSANPLIITNSWNPIWYSVAVTNVASGIYPLTFTLTGATNAASATVNLIVGNRWVNTTPSGDVSWSTGQTGAKAPLQSLETT